MADVAVDSTTATAIESAFGGLRGPYWVSESVGAIALITTGDEVKVYKTTDGGQTWGASAATTSQVIECFDAWFHPQTPGLTDDKLAIAFVDQTTDDVEYVQYDISANTLSSPVAMGGPANTGNPTQDKIAICVTRSGYIYIAATLTNVNHYTYVSTNSGTSFADAGEFGGWGEGAADQFWFASCNTGDGNDCALWFWDASADQISIKTYDRSGNAWAETTFTGTIAESNTLSSQFACTTRLSDGHSLAVVWNAVDAATADLLSLDVYIDALTGFTITAKTNVLTNNDNAIGCSIFVNQLTDAVYVGYLDGTGPIAGGAVAAKYKLSSDGMGSWGSETAYSEDAQDDFRVIHGGAMMASTNGRFGLCWYDDDDNDIFYNYTNSVSITAGVATPTIAEYEGIPQIPRAYQMRRQVVAY